MHLNIKQKKLEHRIGYSFKDASLLAMALTHRSYGALNNERLEFLGDSILNFIIGNELVQKFPDAREGQLSRLRAQLVKGETLAEIAREFELSDYLILGEGEAKSGGRHRDSILSDTIEAIIGAIYSETDFEFCRSCVLQWYSERLDQLTADVSVKDPKSQLQEFLQSKKLPLPDYQVVESLGESHAKIFIVECKIPLLKGAVRAQASSRREAEKLVAAEILNLLDI